MPKGLICEKWELPLIETEKGSKSSFFSHTNRGELSRRALAFEWLLDGIPEDKVWLEPFGGIGLQSVIIQNICKPSTHIVSDLDESCASQLSLVMKQFNGKVAVGNADAIDAINAFSESPDVIVLDFPNFTPMKFDQWEPVLTAAFGRAPKLVEVTDVSLRFLHLHKKRYSEILETEIETKEDYILAMSKYLHSKYDYSVVKAAYKSGTAYMAFGNVPYHEEPEMKFFGSDMSGFRYIDDN